MFLYTHRNSTDGGHNVPTLQFQVLNFALPPLSAAESRRLVRGSPTSMFEHVAAQRIVRVYEEA